MNLVPARPVAVGGGEATVEIAGGARVTVPGVSDVPDGVDGDWMLGVRPEHLRVCAPDEGGLPATVTVVERLGGETLLHAVIAGSETMVIKTGGDQPARLGETVTVAPSVVDCHLFDASGRALDKGRRGDLEVGRPVSMP